jgi:hypothetical protein
MRNPYEYARKAKEAHPERYCAAPNCLWQLVHGQTGMPLAPCAKHPNAGRGKQKECERVRRRIVCDACRYPASEANDTGEHLEIPCTGPNAPKALHVIDATGDSYADRV